MGITDWIVPGRVRRNLQLSIDGLAKIASARAEIEDFDSPRARLWTTLCQASRQTMCQILIRNDDNRMNWGLKRHARRVDDTRLVVLFWWMLLYQIVLFKNRGMDGFNPDDEIGPLYAAARSFIEVEFVRLGVALEPPGPWSENWRREVALESAMALYNCTYQLLNIRNDLSQRIDHVSHFTTITEHAYDRLTTG